jgi:type IV pilus assembly protein PilM
VFNLNGGRLQCVHAAVEQFPVRAAGEDHWLENTAAALRSLKSGHAGADPVVLVLPAHLTLTKQIKTPRVDPAKRGKVIRFEAEQAIPYALAEVVWDSTISGEGETEQEVVLVAAKLDLIEQLCTAVQAAGFTPARILPSSLATLAGWRLVQPAHVLPALVLNLGGRSTTLLQVDSQRFVARTLSLGGGVITQQLAENQDCDPDEAERIKLSERSTNLVADAMETLATRLAQEISRSVIHFGRQSGMANPERVFLTGGSAGLTGLAELLATKLKIPVERFAALDAVTNPAGAASAGMASNPAAFTDLIGAAAAELLPSQPTMNLLPPALRKQANQRRSRPWLLASMVLAMAALGLPTLHYRQVMATARTKIAVMEEAMAPLRARESRNRANLEKLAQLRTQVDGLQSVHNRRAGWLKLFTGLQERLVKVEDVWLEKLQTIPPATGGPMKLVISGRMLDKTNPLAKVSPETFTRVKELLAGIVELPSVSAVEGERFDNSQPGILKFDFVLVIDDAHPL